MLSEDGAKHYLSTRRDNILAALRANIQRKGLLMMTCLTRLVRDTETSEVTTSHSRDTQ